MLKLADEVRLMHDEASDNYYLFCIQTGKHFRLNEIAYEMLSRLSEGKQRIEIIDWVAERFDVDAGTCEEDLEELLSFLSENRLVITD